MSEELWSKITLFLIETNCTVVIEDIKPYSMRLTTQVLDTAKWIGMAVYRLQTTCNAKIELVSRNEIKKWVFDRFNQTILPLVDKRMDKKLFMACDVRTKEIVFVDNYNRPKRKASFVYVNDRCVTEAMKELYGIPKPEPGKGYKYGLMEHSWQALAVASFIHLERT